MVKFKTIQYGSTEFAQAWELQNQILRVPLGLDLYDENLEIEASHYHFGLCQDSTLIAFAIAVPMTPILAKIRQMVVEPDFQNRGMGRALLLNAERDLHLRNYRSFVLHARKSAVPFYEKLGYRAVDKLFIQVKLPHQKIEK